ncbi:MAG TPA: ABC transporter permease [Candidatus Dormibacteraeota bacterium]|nr:ABC transporter permease [Candidatus Dormibacteraeota bacterium]
MAAETRPAPVLPQLRLQVLTELRRLWRVPEFTGFTLAFPAILYLFLGTQKGVYQGVSAHQYVLASLATYSVVNVALFSFGVTVATERGSKIDALLRASPMRPYAPVVAKTVSALVFAVMALAVLYAVAFLVGGVRMDLDRWLSLSWHLLLGMIPFLLMGFAFGYLSSPTAAVAVVNLVFLPMSFASGIFIPITQLPDFIQRVGPYLPMYPLGRLAWNGVGLQYPDLWKSVLELAIWGAFFLALTLLALRLEDNRRFT